MTNLFAARIAACSLALTVIIPTLAFAQSASLLGNSLAAYCHALWLNGSQSLAHYFQGRISEGFSVDIHPAAIIGYGVFIDHGTGIVIGETAVVDDDVSILQEVTLGGTGKASGDRHPKIGRGVLIGAGAEILGNIWVGERAKIGAGSVVLQEVPPHTTVAGVPARVVGHPKADEPGKPWTKILMARARANDQGYIARSRDLIRLLDEPGQVARWGAGPLQICSVGPFAAIGARMAVSAQWHWPKSCEFRRLETISRFGSIAGE